MYSTRAWNILIAVVSVLLLGAYAEASSVEVDIVDVEVFQAAGDVGGGVLVPDTEFPPTQGGAAILKRGDDCLQYTVHTTGLPEGAYTNWWILFNTPEGCTVPNMCGDIDFFNPAADAAAFWATGRVIQANGVGNFHSRVCIGDDLGFPGSQNLFGDGLTNPHGATVWIIIKYHGLASDDPDVLYDQTHTLTGSCEEGANAIDFGDPFGVQCFDPQIAILSPDDDDD